MKILGLTYRDSGCGWHRILMPMGFMDNITGYISNLPTAEKLMEPWDILLYNRLCSIDKDWDDFRRNMSSKIIMDMDDDWILPPGHINYFNYKAIQPRIENNLRNADLVTVTHARLAEKVYPFNHNVEVFPNALPFGHDQYTTDKFPSEVVRLFWAGGISHVKDIELLRGPMKRIKDLPVQVVIGGYTYDEEKAKELERKIFEAKRERKDVSALEQDYFSILHTKNQWDKMVSAFTCGLKIPGAVLHNLSVREYMGHFMHGDIMLVPLEDSPWHSMKSNLKLLEAAAKGMAVVCSKVLPYDEGNPPVEWVVNQGDWYKGVKKLLDKGYREERAEALREWAEQFNLFEVNKRRRECYLKTVQSSRNTAA
jgi:hypothetical protein